MQLEGILLSEDKEKTERESSLCVIHWRHARRKWVGRGACTIRSE